ncbi:endonuclease/exonuclease/phosphatase family protein [uncultured Maribacter sp.]|uniref:endonuclease/exonuclease/phosphatase family protein n=1 Tax=uncultured Maribacter sp. TaxID=431308 RepID=UPI002613FC92|nr:endonuclease/exonuclease/phosphatase family protein [uncultured Maribacter sp.]
MALLLLLACVIPYFPVKFIPIFSFLSLGVPVLVVVNLFFALYWVYVKIRKSLLSILALVIGYVFLGSFVQYNSSTEDNLKEEFSVMTYNTYGFNGLDYNKIKENGINIINFISQQDPDIICFQEFDRWRIKSGELNAYPYNYVDFEFGNHDGKAIQAIYSKFPIIAKGDLNFPDSGNNAIFVDILLKKDTIRIYNVHLQSLKIRSLVNRKGLSNKFYHRMSSSFVMQEEQVDLIEKHRINNKHKTLICGDFNNTQYSVVYKRLKGEFQDTFIEKGSGYGRTYNYHGVQVRIDFILADKEFNVQSHKNFNVKYSDHFPVMASFSLN